MQSTAPLTIHNASIHTATVEVKMLTISGKQVTLSVFRQLREDQIILGCDDGYMLAGTPWGQVNYCPGRGHCELASGLWRPWNNGAYHPISEWENLGRTELYHAHVLWEKDGILRRCAVLGESWEWPIVYGAPYYIPILDAIADLPQLFIAV